MTSIARMSRLPNTDRKGNSFSESVVNEVWAKALPSMGSGSIKVDRYGALIERGRRGPSSVAVHTEMGWEIDHIIPVSSFPEPQGLLATYEDLGFSGPDVSNNLQPLQWYNNRLKGVNAHPTGEIVTAWTLEAWIFGSGHRLIVGNENRVLSIQKFLDMCKIVT